METILSIIAIILSPLIAVFCTILYQNRQEIRKSQMKCFLEIYAYRNSYKKLAEFEVALNSITVLFHKNNTVLQAWKEYLSILKNKTGDNEKNINHKYLDLLFEMSKVLKLRGIKQTDLDDIFLSKELNEISKMEILKNHYEAEFIIETVMKMRSAEKQQNKNEILQ